jgi:precorrin-2 dehydrogenase/sirohydrochlorin ferrochelatase
MLPLAFKMLDRSVLVVGAGRIGAGKAQLLVNAGARVTVIAREQLAPLPEGITAFEQREYQAGDLRGHSLVISASGDLELDNLIVAEARAEGIWLNVVDDPGRSDFYFTAVHRAGDVVVSVSTAGASPALAQVVRTLVRESLPNNLADVARQLRSERLALHRAGQSSEGIDWRPRIHQLLAGNDSALAEPR